MRSEILFTIAVAVIYWLGAVGVSAGWWIGSGKPKNRVVSAVVGLLWPVAVPAMTFLCLMAGLARWLVAPRRGQS